MLTCLKRWVLVLPPTSDLGYADDFSGYPGAIFWHSHFNDAIILVYVMPPKRSGAFIIGRRSARPRRNWGRVRALVRSGAVRRYARQIKYRRVYGSRVGHRPFKR